MRERLRGDRLKREKATATSSSAAAWDEQIPFADMVVGRLDSSWLQTLLDQADVDWSASQTLLNLCGVAVLSVLVLWAVRSRIGRGARVWRGRHGPPLMAFNFRRKRRMTKLMNQLPVCSR